MIEEKTLQNWKQADRYQVTMCETSDPLCLMLFEAQNSGSTIEIIYDGGSSPGSYRKITPKRFFHVHRYDGIYVEAFCYLRNETRIFRLDRMRLVENESFEPVKEKSKSTHRLAWKIVGALIIALILYFITK